MSVLGRAVLVACIFVGPCALASESGQFPGVYVLEGSRAPVTAADREQLELKCALAPGVMKANGAGAGYFLDRELFLATGTVSYVKGQEYRCRYKPDKRIETCDSKELSDGKVLHYYRSNVYLEFTPMVQRGHSLLTPEDVVAWNSKGAVNPESGFAYHRCTCLTGDKVESLASNALNTQASAITGERMYWWKSDPSVEDYALARRVMAALGGCKPEVS